jgi:hypothetical protein
MRALCFTYAALGGLPSLQHSNDILHFPKLLGDASGHRRAHLERLMDADKIAIQEMQAHRVMRAWFKRNAK